MTRKASGYLTKTGHFYSTKNEADMREALDDMDNSLHDHLTESNLEGAALEFIMDKVKEFVLLNKEVVKRYITLIDKVPEINKTDIRSVLFQPATEPVEYSYTEASTEILIDEDTDAFVSAFDGGTMEPIDGSGEEAGGDEMDRQLGEEEPSVPE